MSEVSFHFNVPDKRPYWCRLLRKAYRGGWGVFVLGDADTLETLDQLLWSFSAQDFIPHARLGAAADVWTRSPIGLGEVLPSGPARWPVLLNTRSDVPSGFEAFQRVIEVVSRHEDDRQQARSRWRQYVQCGCQPRRHDVALTDQESS